MNQTHFNADAMRMPTAPQRPHRHGDPLILDTVQAQAIVRLVESAPAVRRRNQFFVWTQSQMQALLPHQLLVCGAYQRQQRALVMDLFHNIVLPPEVVQPLTGTDSPLVEALVQHWVHGRGQPRAMPLAQLDGASAAAAQALSAGLGYTHLMVHGVARPQRPTEIESLFILGGIGGGAQWADRCACLDLMLPHLHNIWLRVTATELELQRPAKAAKPRSIPAIDAAPPVRCGSITLRERQILRWVREGRRNQQIAEVLSISPLTVKNHVQKILRKLGAGNRAQAVALALAHKLIEPAEIA